MKKRKVILIFGRTGSGKSFLTKKIIEKLNRVVVIDTMYEYNDGMIFYNLKTLIEEFINNKPETFKYICRFDNDNDIELLFKFCWYVKNLVLVLEESELYISPFQKQSEFLKLIRYGRHKAISIIAIARRVVELSNDVKANANIIITFKQILNKDLEYLGNLGFNKETVMNLKTYEYSKVLYD